MRQFYHPELTKEVGEYILPVEESKHISKVLRMKVDDKIQLLNGKGLIAEAIITENHPKHTKVQLDTFYFKEASKNELHIAIAPTKMNDRMEYFLEKSTEIGVDKISLLVTDNSERTKIKLERFEKILVSAMKQSKRVYLPVLEDIKSCKDFIKENPGGLIAHCYEGTKSTIGSCLKKVNCPIIIGPEGDFSLEELELAKSNDYAAISLGENRLRTETAGIYACVAAKIVLDSKL